MDVVILGGERQLASQVSRARSCRYHTVFIFHFFFFLSLFLQKRSRNIPPMNLTACTRTSAGKAPGVTSQISAIQQLIIFAL